MKYEIRRTSRFKKDFKLAVKRGYDVQTFETVVSALASGHVLEIKYKDHPLSGTYANYRECHITPDWLLVYKLSDDILVLTLIRTGTHSDLF